MWKDMLNTIVDVLQGGVVDSFYAMKRRVIRSMVEVFALSLSALLIIIGVMILAILHLPLDVLALLLIILGLIGFSATLLVMKL